MTLTGILLIEIMVFGFYCFVFSAVCSALRTGKEGSPVTEGYYSYLSLGQRLSPLETSRPSEVCPHEWLRWFSICVPPYPSYPHPPTYRMF